MNFNINSLTPLKSEIVTKVKGKYIEQHMKFINNKGTFKRREQCKSCLFCGQVQTGLYNYMDISCDRETGFWKQASGNTDKTCNYYKEK